MIALLDITLKSVKYVNLTVIIIKYIQYFRGLKLNDFKRIPMGLQCVLVFPGDIQISASIQRVMLIHLKLFGN